MAGLKVMTDEQTPLPAQQREPSSSTPPPVSPTVIAAHFKLIFLSGVGLTAALFAISLIVALKVDHPSESLLHTMCDFLFLAGTGFGTLTGLVKGKSQ